MPGQWLWSGQTNGPNSWPAMAGHGAWASKFHGTLGLLAMAINGWPQWLVDLGPTFRQNGFVDGPWPVMPCLRWSSHSCCESSVRRISDNSFLEHRASEMPPSICRGPKTLNPSKKWSNQLFKTNVRDVEVTERYKFFGATPVFVIKSSQGGWTACKLLPRLTLQPQYHIRYEIRY